jgi:hypothetical protein
MGRFDPVAWFAEHGRTCYAEQIHAVQATKSEVIAEAGPNGHLCPFVAEQVRKLDAEIEEIRRAAADRYDDYASDPL